MDSDFHEIEMGPVGARIPRGPVRSVEAAIGGVVARFDDGSLTLDADWLRDNCPCSTCRIVQTDERRWQPWLEVEPQRVASAEVTGAGLLIRWTSGHESLYTAETWADIDRASRRGIWTAHVWSAGYELERFDHGAAETDLVTRRRLFEAFRRDGAIVVTGSPCVPGTCLEFVRNLGLTVCHSSLGLIFDVKLDPAGYNVAFTAEHVPPHNDNAQYTHPPSGQVLAMLVNDATGGESIVVDGWNVVEQLMRSDPAAVDVLSRVAVGHRQYSTDAEGYSRSPLIVRDREGKVTHLRFSNQLMQPLPFDDPDLAEWYRAYRLLGAVVTDPANHVSFRLCAGDMLFVNGYRVLHSRTAFRPDGPRHLQDIYFEVDDVLGNLDRMSGEATDAMVVAS